MVEPVIGVSYMFLHEGKLKTWSQLDPGAMWLEDGELVCKIPGGSAGSEWQVDRGRLMNADPERAGKKRLPEWTRTGEPPNITVSPSINYMGFYHGWLCEGVLSDDCEGRQL